MSNCPIQKAKSFLWINQEPDIPEQQEDISDIDGPVKQKVTDILGYLTKKDLTRIDEGKQEVTLEDFDIFINSISNLEDEEFVSVLSEHIKQNISNYRKLKKELNNLHVKMFWEYFKEQLEELWEHDFFWIEDWNLINIPLSHYTWSLWYIQKNINKDIWLNISKRYILWDYLEKVILFDYISWKIPLLKKINAFEMAEKSIIRIEIMLESLEKVLSILYDKFISENKENYIVKSYLGLEDIIWKEVWFNSNFKSIFPNHNKFMLREFLMNRAYNSKTINLYDIKVFLEKQNTENLRKALYWWSFWAQLDNLVFAEDWEYLVYDEEKWIITTDIDKVPKEEIEKINSMIKEYKLEEKWDWKCPFAQVKSWNKNALIDEFEFFDKYMLKILEHFYK